jgi:hypothetical protein
LLYVLPGNKGFISAKYESRRNTVSPDFIYPSFWIAIIDPSDNYEKKKKKNVARVYAVRDDWLIKVITRDAQGTTDLDLYITCVTSPKVQ